MKEGDLVKAIIKAVNKLPNYKVWRNQSGKVRVKGGWMQLSPTGTPDIIGYTDKGIFLAIEVKLPNKNPTAEQEQFKAECKGICITARSVDDVLDFLLAS